MRVLVIGGTGLISTPMVRQLAERGYDVTVANRGRRATQLPQGVRQIITDRQAFAEFERQMAGESFDVVIDMVCFVREEAESLVRAFAGRIKQLIFCSTVDVYQRPASKLPYTEDEPLIGLSDYAKNKILCEETLVNAHEDGTFAVTRIRPAHTYSDKAGLIHTMGWSATYVDRLLKGKPVVVHGDGTSLWASCHAEDVSVAFVNACLNEVAFGKAYHTTGTDWLTWDRYNQTVAEAIGAPAPTLVHIPTETLVKFADRASICLTNFMHHGIYDNSLAEKDLGFRQTIPWIEGAARIYKNMVAEGRIPNSDDDPYDDNVIAQWRHLEAQLVKV